MDYLVDMHTHTVASGHAVNTEEEMVLMAQQKGLKVLGITDHTKTMPGTCGEQHFVDISNKKNIYDNIDVLYGAELNIVDYDGNVDMPQALLAKMDVTIASIHNTIGYEAGSIEQNTNAAIGAIKNPYINIIGHMDDGNIPIDYDAFTDYAVEYGTIIEINNNSLVPGCFRSNTKENICTILELCKRKGCPVVIGSDAHCTDNVGRHIEAVDIMHALDFPERLILNYYPEEIKMYLNKYKIH